MCVLEAVVPTRVQERLCVCCALASFGSDTGKTWNRARLLDEQAASLAAKTGFYRLGSYLQAERLHPRHATARTVDV